MLRSSIPAQFVDCLLELGSHQITLQDPPVTAFAEARARLPNVAPVHWVLANASDWKPFRLFDDWHDRATLYFLTETADQKACLRIMDRALLSSAHATTGTFAPGGPTRCSGLPVARYVAALLFGRLDKGSDWAMSLRHDHNTPSGS